MKKETIAAIASGMTASGIGIVRISGPEAFPVADRICTLKNGRKPSEEPSHVIRYGYVTEDGHVLDEALFMLMRSPRTFTTEDTVEINCHGGISAMRKVLLAALKAGARAAEPGEFTKRAFLNGRIDLSEAEAVMDLIEATNDYALKSAVSVLRGSVRREVEEIRITLLHHLSRIEASLDDPEHLGLDEEGEDPFEEAIPYEGVYTEDFMQPERMKAEVYRKTLTKDVEAASQRIGRLIQSYEDGRLLRQGIRTVILGKPNAGKSSLLNLLSGQERAIVTDIEGTTRDILEETVRLSDLTLILTDTAGIRKTDEVVERIGVDRARQAAEEADLILYVADSLRELDENDREILHFLEGKKAVTILNKMDQAGCLEEETLRKLTGGPVIAFSAKTGKGLEDLETCLKELFALGRIAMNEEVILTSERQRQALFEALSSLDEVKKSIAGRMSEDFYAIDLMEAYSSLGRVVGQDVGEDVINEVFSRFCMGK